MAGAVGRRRRERGSPRLRRFPLIFSRSPPIPDAGLPSFFDAPDRLKMHVQIHGEPHLAGLRMLCTAASYACSRSWLLRSCGPQLPLLAFLTCAMSLQLGPTCRYALRDQAVCTGQASHRDILPSACPRTAPQLVDIARQLLHWYYFRCAAEIALSYLVLENRG